MPPKRKSQGPRRYGRQAEGKTIKTLSLSADVVAWAEQEATAAGMSFSGWLQAQLQAARSDPLYERGKGYTAQKPAGENE